jgi:hypothetical protein
MKKSISFLLVAFLIILGVAKSDVVSAQLGAQDKTYVHPGEGWIAVPVSADGLDQVWVWTEFRCVCHWIDGVMQWMHMWYQFEFTFDGEDFIVKTEQDYAIGAAKNDDYTRFNDVTFRCNIKGSEGTHIVASGIFRWGPYWTFEIDQFIIQPKQ